jgi:tRNA pseudouridine38-40 synthase
MTLSYDGTRFSGWQRQTHARSVQGVLEEAFRSILGRRVIVTGAGRTDGGVHALGQVAHADIPARLPLPKLHRALNAVLPEDLVIQTLTWAPAGFHARYGAKSKWYRYRIWNHPVRPVMERHWALHVPSPLNLTAMRRCARLFVGRRDFRAFHSSGRCVASTVRHLRQLTLRRNGPWLIIDMKADGFLYHMARRMVGLLLEVGKGRVSPTDCHRIIPPTAPAHGLCLMRVEYGNRRALQKTDRMED